jgi:peptide/nickel transport system permease protein
MSARAGAILAVVILSVWLLCALAAPWLAPQDPLAQSMGLRLQPPSGYHWLGTDLLGRDILSRLIYGARPALGLAALVAVLMVPVGVTVGIVAGYLGGWVDRVLSALTSLVMALPRLVLVLAFVGLLGPGIVNAALALVLTGWPAYARLARVQTLQLRGLDYIAAAQMQGINGTRLILGHILPACVPALRVRLALDLAGIILLAAALGFVGIGVRPPTPEWGMMVAEGGRVVFDQWWVALAPGLAIFAVSLACNTLADSLRELEGTSR